MGFSSTSQTLRFSAQWGRSCQRGVCQQRWSSRIIAGGVVPCVANPARRRHLVDSQQGFVATIMAGNEVL